MINIIPLFVFPQGKRYREDAKPICYWLGNEKMCEIWPKFTRSELLGNFLMDWAFEN